MLSACSSFLDEDPQDRFVIDDFYKNAGDAEAAVNAIYAQLYEIYKRRMYLMADLPTDDHKNGKGMPNTQLINLEYARFTADNQFVREMWLYNYTGIMSANAAIINIPGIVMDEELKNRLLAEAKFLRALYYFNLVRFYGDVPLIKKLFTVNNIHVERIPKEEVYESIIEDLTFAGEKLPKTYDFTDVGRATSGAAKILLAKVYLTIHEYGLAEAKIKEVVLKEGDYGYGLHDEYKANWKEDTELGKEMVFSIEYLSEGGESNNQMALDGPKFSIHKGAGVPGLKSAKEADIPSQELYNLFLEEDSRKHHTFKLEYESPNNGEIYQSFIPLFGKYWEDGQIQLNKSSVNMHILRYADALLMYAEVLNENDNTADAIIYLNKVRQRAFQSEDYNYQNLSKDDLRLAIYKERRLELAHEGHRWFDLVRTNRFIERMREHGTIEAELAEEDKNDISQNIQDHMVLMPIPQYEIDLNPEVVQNPGY
ncbi:RagB/SusD family nutrient uptake outer membrane protein [Labilibacter sediminis]|nr:RagB/SusD family nutrient uptake outer membrane protein [Labilibacter sediminis]